MSKRSILLICLAVLCLFVAIAPSPASAQCLPGIPCVTGLTANDPQTPDDGPNVGGPNAPKSASASCDADFMNQLYGRAFLEAEREINKSQIVLRKPDSVMEYSCFDRFVSHAALTTDPIFSGSGYWSGQSVPINGKIKNSAIGSVTINTALGDTHLDKNLDTLVLSPLSEFLKSNFSHDLMGGSAGGFAYTPLEETGGGYTCDIMNLVHIAARCNNFMTDDLFYSFQELSQFDPRALPDSLKCEGTAITPEIIALAENVDAAYAAVDTLAETHLQSIKAISGGACGPPIPTGVLITKSLIDIDTAMGGDVLKTPLDAVPDIICSTPSCYFDGSGCVAG